MPARSSSVSGTPTRWALISVGAYTRSFRECAEALAAPGAFQRVLDYPLGKLTGCQTLAVRTDTTIHAWDLVRAW